MSTKKKPDTRVPQPITPESIQAIKTFMTAMPDYTDTLLNISADDVKRFKKLSADDRQYIKDVVGLLETNTKVATNVNLDNLKKAQQMGD